MDAGVLQLRPEVLSLALDFAVRSLDLAQVHHLLELGALLEGRLFDHLTILFREVDRHFREAVSFEVLATSQIHLNDPVAHPVEHPTNVKLNAALLMQAEAVVHALLCYQPESRPLPSPDVLFPWYHMRRIAGQYIPSFHSSLRVNVLHIGRATRSVRAHAVRQCWLGAVGTIEPGEISDGFWSNCWFRVKSCAQCCHLWWWSCCCAPAPNTMCIGSREMTFSEFTANQMKSWWATRATPETIVRAHQTVVLRRSQLRMDFVCLLEPLCIPPLIDFILAYLEPDVSRWMVQNYAEDVAGLFHMPDA